jgi:hypothetical protein
MKEEYLETKGQRIHQEIQKIFGLTVNIVMTDSEEDKAARRNFIELLIFVYRYSREDLESEVFPVFKKRFVIRFVHWVKETKGVVKDLETYNKSAFKYAFLCTIGNKDLWAYYDDY